MPKVIKYVAEQILYDLSLKIFFGDKRLRANYMEEKTNENVGNFVNIIKSLESNQEDSYEQNRTKSS